MNTPARNSPCPCGSGKKYKKCCLINASSKHAYPAQRDKSRNIAFNTNNAAQPESMLNTGVAYQQSGKLEEAEIIYRSLLKNNPDDSDALHYLGLISYQKKQYSDAIKQIGEAIKINNKVPAFYYNLGNAHKAAGQFDAAIAAFHEAIRLDPLFSAAYGNLGSALTSRGDLEEAVTSCRRALEIKPDFAEAHHNLGSALYNLGRLDEAAACYRRAIQAKPDYAEAQLNLGHTCYMADKIAEAAVAYQEALKIDPANQGLEAAVYLSILFYLEGNLEQCQAMLNASRPILTSTDSKYKNALVYWVYLDKLLSGDLQTHENDISAEKIEPLYVVGESQSLSAHAVKVRYNGQDMQCMTEWIIGCKQWHLGNDKPNIYKYKFEAVMARLPRNSKILLRIGAIDCRHDEGIITAWKKRPEKSLDEVIQATIDGFLRYVMAIAARYEHRIIIGGVAATNISLDILTKTDAEQFVNLIRLFNQTLKKRTLAEGMDFLDIYALTDRGDGISNGDWHIDNYHLVPGAMLEAFDKHTCSTDKKRRL